MAHCLDGKTITEMMISDDNHSLLFRCADGDVVAVVEAECCSHTWIESVELPALGFPARVQSARDLGLHKAPVSDEDYDYLQFYGFAIETDKGGIVIDYRNESNGYYGGDLAWPGDIFYEETCADSVSTSAEWVPIKDAG